MSDIFISYARSTAAKAQQAAEALRALGYGVWRDDELPAHRAYAEVIAERLSTAKAVLVIWSAEAVKSEWVQSEADQARADRKLVQMSIDGARLPMPFDRIQCADLSNWDGDLEAPGWRKVVASVAELVGRGAPAANRAETQPEARKLSICVLPFANMSGDPEQEYFSDGISEDIITDLSKISALSVIARNSAFAFKGKSVDVQQVARQLSVAYVLEGSVRKSGGRVRITAQLIDGARNDHVWAERYDRDLTDIFALQDEISEAIVKALKLKLLPEEKKAIEKRGTDSAEAYNLYLMARQYWLTGNSGDSRRDEAIIRLTGRATEIDPGYARAWALMACAQESLRTLFGGAGDGGLEAAEQALALDPDLAEAHAVRASIWIRDGRQDEAAGEIATALELDPQSYEVNNAAALLSFHQRRLEDAVRYWEKAAALMETDIGSSGMLVTAYTALGDVAAARRAAKLTLTRAGAMLAQDRSNGNALGFGVGALACLGEGERAKEWIERALLLDPGNMVMRYNCACTTAVQLKDAEAALEMLGPVVEKATPEFVAYVKVDPDLDPIREDARFTAMIAAAEARLAGARPAAAAEA
ncbi:MAG TPA: TIR domain-containing protein [Caulobacteraceae bacterium]|nr:TIR domain-containing protein [Caulobacteraceae bacterium]